METTVGRLMVEQALPPGVELRQGQKLDKGTIKEILQQVAEDHPEKFKQVLEALSDIGRRAAWESGVTVSLTGLGKSKAKEKILGPMRRRMQQILADQTLSQEERNKKLIDLGMSVSSGMQDALMEEAKAEGNPFYYQIASGARGNPGSLVSLRGADVLVQDHAGETVPVPIDRSYAEGLTPAQYFASTYGQRKGMLDTKLSVADAGFLSKKLSNAVHRQVVTREKPAEYRHPVGLPVDVDDRDSVGSVLAADAGPYKAGEVVSARMLKKLKDRDVDQVLVHSPLTDFDPDGGLSAYAAGRRTRGGLSEVGDQIGLPASQAIGERLSQGLLDSKHSAGVNVRVAKSGFEFISRMIEAPENFPGSGPLAQEDGDVTDIRDAPQGGKYVTIGEQDYYIPPDVRPIVNVGQTVEQGDDLTDGVPHPNDLVRLRGMGEARRVYLREMGEILRNSGVPHNRRNLENVTAGLLNWARVTNPDGLGDNIVDDVVPYNRLIANYRPRKTAQSTTLSRARGRYLEEPVLHYTPGTRLTNKVIEDLKRWNIREVLTDEDPPDFEPQMVRGVHSVYHEPDWRARLGGFYTSSGFKDSVRRGATSDTNSTSYFPALARGQGFGQQLEQQGTYGSPVRSPPPTAP